VFFKSPSAHQLYFYFISLFFLIGYFALIYKSFGVIPPTANVSSQVGWLDAIYFSVVTWTTLGYGDFRPGDEVKLWVIAEALIGYIYMGLLVGKLLIIGQKRIE
jgi:voltage-gated potassium channel Kch